MNDFLIRIILTITFILTQNIAVVWSQHIVTSTVTLTANFKPFSLKGLSFPTANPLQIEFIFDHGDTNYPANIQEEQTMNLVRYFMSSVTIPADQFWVNLSPHEEDRIMAASLTQTDMGHDLLSQDFMLKKLATSLMHPETESGKIFWNKIHSKIDQQFGYSEIDLDNFFNKIWIVSESAQFFQHKNGVYLVDSRLKVMLEEDYLAKKEHLKVFENFLPHGDLNSINDVALETYKEILLPLIEHEVNHGEIFANLRQIYQSILLGQWYKDSLRKSILSEIYINQEKVTGISVEDNEAYQKTYSQYVQAFQNGLFNYQQEEYLHAQQEIVKRSYFSGGWSYDQASLSQEMVNKDQAAKALEEADSVATVLLEPVNKDQAAVATEERLTFEDIRNKYSFMASDQFVETAMSSFKEIAREANNDFRQVLDADFPIDTDIDLAQWIKEYLEWEHVEGFHSDINRHLDKEHELREYFASQVDKAKSYLLQTNPDLDLPYNIQEKFQFLFRAYRKSFYRMSYGAVYNYRFTLEPVFTKLVKQLDSLRTDLMQYFKHQVPSEKFDNHKQVVQMLTRAVTTSFVNQYLQQDRGLDLDVRERLHQEGYIESPDSTIDFAFSPGTELIRNKDIMYVGVRDDMTKFRIRNVSTSLNIDLNANLPAVLKSVFESDPVKYLFSKQIMDSILDELILLSQNILFANDIDLEDVRISTKRDAFYFLVNLAKVFPQKRSKIAPSLAFHGWNSSFVNEESEFYQPFSISDFFESLKDESTQNEQGLTAYEVLKSNADNSSLIAFIDSVLQNKDKLKSKKIEEKNDDVKEKNISRDFIIAIQEKYLFFISENYGQEINSEIIVTRIIDSAVGYPELLPLLVKLIRPDLEDSIPVIQKIFEELDYSRASYQLLLDKEIPLFVKGLKDIEDFFFEWFKPKYYPIMTFFNSKDFFGSIVNEQIKEKVIQSLNRALVRFFYYWYLEQNDYEISKNRPMSFFNQMSQQGEITKWDEEVIGLAAIAAQGNDLDSMESFTAATILKVADNQTKFSNEDFRAILSVIPVEIVGPNTRPTTYDQEQIIRTTLRYYEDPRRPTPQDDEVYPYEWLLQIQDAIGNDAFFVAVRIAAMASVYQSELEVKYLIYEYANQFLDEPQFPTPEIELDVTQNIFRFGDRNFVRLLPKPKDHPVGEEYKPQFQIVKHFEMHLPDDFRLGAQGFYAEQRGLKSLARHSHKMVRNVTTDAALGNVQYEVDYRIFLYPTDKMSAVMSKDEIIEGLKETLALGMAQVFNLYAEGKVQSVITLLMHADRDGDHREFMFMHSDAMARYSQLRPVRDLQEFMAHTNLRMGVGLVDGEHVVSRQQLSQAAEVDQQSLTADTALQEILWQSLMEVMFTYAYAGFVNKLSRDEIVEVIMAVQMELKDGIVLPVFNDRDALFILVNAVYRDVQQVFATDGYLPIQEYLEKFSKMERGLPSRIFIDDGVSYDVQQFFTESQEIIIPKPEEVLQVQQARFSGETSVADQLAVVSRRGLILPGEEGFLESLPQSMQNKTIIAGSISGSNLADPTNLSPELVRIRREILGQASGDEKDEAALAKGGIDLNLQETDAAFLGEDFNFQVDAIMNEFQYSDEVDGFVPVLLNIRPVVNIYQLIGF